MTTYTFESTANLVNWNDPAIWSGNIVPNSSDADVIFPPVYIDSGGNPYVSNVIISAGDSFQVNSVELRDTIKVSGNLTVSHDITSYNTGSIDLSGGTISAETIISSGSYLIDGSGTLNVDFLNNDKEISVGGVDDHLIINANSFDNTGTLSVSNGIISINVAPGGFANYNAGELSGGYYNANALGTLAINSGVITTDAANILLAGGTITGHDAGSGQDVPITTSLHEVAPQGVLAIESATYTFGQLDVAGTVTFPFSSGLGAPVMSTNGHLISSQLTIAPGGLLEGAGRVDAPITNDGKILALATANGVLVLNGSITGQGTLEIGPKGFGGSHGLSWYESAVLELNGAVSQHVQFDSEIGVLRLDQPSNFTGTITPSGAGDIITLSGVSQSSITGVSYAGDTHAGTLTLQQAAGSLALNFEGNYTTASFALSANVQQPGSLDITVKEPVCFVAGTRILTPRGEIPVEDLAVGTAVSTWDGKIKTIVWIGSGSMVVNRAHPRSRPVIVKAGALGPDIPHRDLRVTEGHSLYLDHVLVPASSLINGRTIVWDDRARSVTYFHIELEDHDILVAEGAPAESYRDDGNRLSFDRISGLPGAQVAQPFAPILTEGAEADAIWQRLVNRAGGAIRDLTGDPDLHLLVNGERIDPCAAEGTVYHFAIASTCRQVVVASRSVVPAMVGTARDYRTLGVGIRQITIRSHGDAISVPYESGLLATGFHEAERAAGLRWTDGAGRIDLPGMDEGPVMLAIELGCVARYPSDDATAAGDSTRPPNHLPCLRR